MTLTLTDRQIDLVAMALRAEIETAHREKDQSLEHELWRVLVQLLQALLKRDERQGKA